MKSFLRYILWIGFLCFLPIQHIQAQKGHFYSTAKGLSSSLINYIYQDSRGFIWIATEYGLNRFDGLNFTNYWHIPEDTTSIGGNFVYTLYEDKRNNLWIGYSDGLMCYDRETDTFKEIPMICEGKRIRPNVVQITEMSNDELWVATLASGLFRLNRQTGQVVSISDELKEIGDDLLFCFYEDSHSNIWMAKERRDLICYTPKTGEKKTYYIPSDVSGNAISDIIEDKSGNLFVATLRGGVFRYDSQRNSFRHVPYKGKGAILAYCFSLIDDRLLVGTDGQGLKVFNAEEDCLEDYTMNASPFDLSEGKIHTIWEDKDKNLWLGLFQKGVVLIPSQENPFEYYGYRSVYANPLGQGCIMSVFKDSNSHLWVGADSEGIYELDAAGNRLNHYSPSDSPNSAPTTVMCFFEDSEGNFWVGSYTNGLACMNRKQGTFEYMSQFSDKIIYSLTEDKNKNLYIATLGAGFYQYNLRTKELTHYPFMMEGNNNLTYDGLRNGLIIQLLCDREGLVWIAHSDGVSCFNPDTKSFLNGKGENAIVTDCKGYALMEDYLGNIWAGTTNGLYCYDKKSEAIQQFTTEEGLSNNVICGLCEDNRHNIWISTYKGLNQYDVKDNRFINYYVGDGLQGNEFMHGAFYRDSSGKLYFGGMDGLTFFSPDVISNEPRNEEVRIIGFSVFDRSINKNDYSGGRAIIDSSVMDADCFRLSHKDNTFTIIFSTLQYNNPEHISYQYRMEEFDQRWLTTDLGINRVTYNNLPAGKYTFLVRAKNQGSYSDVRTIKIIITPAWYATGWAFCFYLLLIGLILWVLLNNLQVRLRHRREIMEREHVEQLNEAKLQLFINISHEIRTPMTLIINPIEKLLADKREVSQELRKTYLMIYRNARRILRLINQLMDIRKLDKGQMFLKYRETDMVGFINDVMQPFEVLAYEKEIEFTFVHEMAELKVWVDMSQFDKVLMNILSNAFKYTFKGGMIQVLLSTGEDSTCQGPLRNYFEIVVLDNGIGIDQDKIERIFERFYQIDNDMTKANYGTGIGLHLSRSLVQLHHGTIHAENRKDSTGCRFVIRLPLGNTHLRADELDDQTSLPIPHSVIKPIGELAEEEGKTPSKRSNARLRILVVEDDEEIRSYLKKELSSEYRVSTCCNGKEGYDLILREKPDLVISDIMMPEMDGLSLCYKVKQNTTVNHIPILLLTAKSNPEDTLEGLETGADGYIVKPFNTEILKSTINSLITNRKLLRNKFSGAQQQEDKIEKISIKSSDELLMERIMKVINSQISNPELNVVMLAAEVGLSRVHVHRKLKELTSLSTRDFIKNIRLQQAAALLRQDKKMTISEIAYAVGFTNLSHFSSSFKEKYGVSPKEYMNTKHT